jgi:hypothetical protein
MSDFTCQALGCTAKAEVESNTTKLCQGLAIVLDFNQVIDQFGHYPTWGYVAFIHGVNVEQYKPIRNGGGPRLQGPITAPQKLIAAITVRDAHLVRGTLPLLSNSAGWICPVLGAALNAAVIRRTDAPIIAILQWLEQPNIRYQGLDDVLTSNKYGFNISAAISIALRRRNCRVLQLLVDFHDKHLSPVEKGKYNSWVALACFVYDVTALRAVLRMKFKGPVQITRENMICAMYGRTVQHVVEMLNSKGMHANKQFTNTNPLVAAIRSHKVDNVRAVLDAGAEVDRGARLGNEDLSPFELLIRTTISADDRKDIARLLLDRGATLADPALWRSSKAYRRLRRMLKGEQLTRKSRK